MQAEASLRAERAVLGRAASAQRAASAAAEQARTRIETLRAVLNVAPMPVPDRVEAQLTTTTERHARRARVADAKLLAVTQDAASAQAVALDADRRFRALRRASATQQQRDTTLGSWRFGSGGPAVSAASLDDYLAGKGSPLTGSGAAFLEAGIKHEIDPRFVLAIAGAESYFGITTCASFNAWGWGCPNGPFVFDSWAHGFETVAVGLREGYVDDGLTSVGEIHLRYAPPDAANDPTDLNYGWADNVARFLIEQGGDPQNIEGVLGPSN